MDQVDKELQEHVLRNGSERLMIFLKNLVLSVNGLEIENLSFLCNFLGGNQNCKAVFGQAFEDLDRFS